MASDSRSGDHLGPFRLNSPALVGLTKDALDTPVLLLDLNRFERNAAKLARSLRDHGVGWRPHTKAHKSPYLARRQMDLGAIGVTCAKTSEAEVMVEHGITNVLIANEQGSASAFRRIAELNRRAEVITCADSPLHVSMASAAGTAAGVAIPMLVSVDIGMQRTGVAPGQDALDLALLADSTQGVRFLGLMGFEGHLVTIEPPEEKDRRVVEAVGRLTSTKDLIEESGIRVEVVSAGGSATYRSTARVQGVTEVQAGGVCFSDLFYGETCHLEDEFDYALTVLSTVTSVPARDRAIIDAGFKAMSDNELGRPRALDRGGVTVIGLAAEHGILRLAGGERIEIGDRIEWIPGYTDSTTFLHNYFVGIRDGCVVEVIPLLARGSLT